MTQEFSPVAEVAGDPSQMRVYEHGWQSWSPAGLYPASATSPRPRRPEWQTMAFRPGRPGPPTGFQGEGLLGLIGPEDVYLWTAPDPARETPSIRAEARGDRVLVSADGPVEEHRGGDLADVLTGWAEAFARRAGVGRIPSLGPGWCSWYGYWADVTEADVLENLAAIDRLGLPVTTVQVDDGHQEDIGDWLTRSPRFGPSGELAARIRDTGREAGVWTAPFLVGERSRLAAEHPEWLVRGAVASPKQWDQEVRVLDVTHPGAAEHLLNVYRSFAADGFGYHKIDFLYAGAMEGGRHTDASGLDAYREGLRLVREGIGPEATLLGCGAPLLPSVGLVDAMRVSPDIHLEWEPVEGDISQPSGRGAVAAGRARGWMHARFWVNDPDCILVRPEMERREDWAAHIGASGGLAVSGDPLNTLDDVGVSLTRAVLRPSSTEPLAWAPA